MKSLHIAKILFFITLLISIGLVGCGEEYDDDDDDYYHYYGNVLFDDPTDAGSPIPSFQDDILPILTNRCAFAGHQVCGQLSVTRTSGILGWPQ